MQRIGYPAGLALLVGLGVGVSLLFSLQSGELSWDEQGGDQAPAASARVLSQSAASDDAGSAKAYLRAASFRGRVQGKVLNEQIHEAWLDADRLIYREQTALDAWRFKIADAKRNKIEQAFDHPRVAEALGKLRGEKLDADTLPFQAFKAGEKDVLFARVGGRVYEISSGGRDVRVADPAASKAFDLNATFARSSRNGGRESEVVFVNESKRPVLLFWVDANGGERAYGELAANESKRQHTFSGHLWLVKNASQSPLGYYQAEDFPGVIRIDGLARAIAPAIERKDASISPDGKWQASIKANNLFVTDLKRGETHQLTHDGSWQDGYRGGFWYSPDSEALIVRRTRPAQQHKVSIVESSPSDQLQPKLHQFDYLKPGDQIWQQWPELFDLKKLERLSSSRALFENPWSIGDLKWQPDSKGFTFLYNQRGHQVQRLIRMKRDGSVETLIEEAPETFVNYSNKTFLHRINDDEQAIWMSERSGWNQLYLMDLKRGRVKHSITQGEWVVRDVLKVDEASETIHFTAMGVFEDQDPYHLHYGVVDFDGKGLRWLTAGDSTHEISYSPQREYIVDRYSRVDLPPVHEIRDATSGELVLELTKADWSPLLEEGWKPPHRFVAKARDGETDIWGYLIEPSVIARGQSLPVIESIYAGPHGHHVPKSFSAWRGERELSELGFYVVKIDGMGTNWRSKAFHDVCWQNLGDAGLPDRVSWIAAIAREFPQMDTDSVGIYGGSAGGQNAMRALITHGDFYRAAAADCGCHDNRMDKIWWNEAWMGWPIGKHYAEHSNVTQAHKITGDLLLTVGELDRNVDPASTMQVVDALIKADKDFELIVVPGAGHGAGESDYCRRRRADFFVRKLLKREPRWER